MSADISAASQRYTLSGLSFSSLNFTMMCWVKRDTDTNNYAVPVDLITTPTGYAVFTTDSTGDLLFFEHNMEGGAEDINITGPTLNNTDWFFLCGTRAGTGTNSGKFYYAANAAALSLAQATIASSFTATALTIGDHRTDTTYFNGKIANVKIWSAALTQAEIELERWQFQPRITSTLVGWWPLFAGGAVAAAQTDYSGNGRTLSGGTGSTTGDNPPIVWAPVQASQVPLVGSPSRLALTGVGR